MRKLVPVIGLEIHIQLNSLRKLFSRGKRIVHRNLEANSNANLWDLGIPGTLPQLNENFIESALKLGVLLNFNINQISHFDRKHYLYPDLPNGYQITQHRLPLGEDGYLTYPVKLSDQNECSNGLSMETAQFERLQLEHDSGKSIEIANDLKLIDYNRSGVGLVELITKPCFYSIHNCVSFIDELIKYLREWNLCECRMELGELRFDVNISLHRHVDDIEGRINESDLSSFNKRLVKSHRVEIKNMNSLKHLKIAANYEIERQRNGNLPSKEETRKYNHSLRSTKFQRMKEDELDYRYCPEFNLPSLLIDEENIRRIFMMVKGKRRVDRYQILMGKPYEITSFHLLEKFNSQLNIVQIYRKLLMELNVKNEPKYLERILYLHLLFEKENELKLSQIHITSLGKFLEEKFIQFESIPVIQKKIQIDHHDCTVKNYENILRKEIIKNELNLIEDRNHLEEIIKTFLENEPKAIAQYRQRKLKGSKKADRMKSFFFSQCQSKNNYRLNNEKMKRIIEKYLNNKNL
ncbi:hypothetical protein SNEBB_006577 [Seison nebaliae]|nr:hypothetical protein SNEBB_006577 [Seison nebaliae]